MVYPPHIQALGARDPALADAVLSYETELDALHPKWRLAPSKEASFDHLPLDYKKRIKWLLKRRDLLLHTTGGVSDPRDWQVQVTESLKKRTACFAHPVPPSAGSTANPTEPPESPLAAFRRAP